MIKHEGVLYLKADDYRAMRRRCERRDAGRRRQTASIVRAPNKNSWTEHWLRRQAEDKPHRTRNKLIRVREIVNCSLIE